jgi:hypothetical protein
MLVKTLPDVPTLGLGVRENIWEAQVTDVLAALARVIRRTGLLAAWATRAGDKSRATRLPVTRAKTAERVMILR